LGEFWPNLEVDNPVQELSDRCYKALAKDLKNWGHEGKLALPLQQS